MTGESRTCLHCEADIPSGTSVTINVDGEEKVFCCRGCQGAWELITGAGLDDYYARRTLTETGSSGGVSLTEYGEEYLTRFIYQAEDASGIDILIEGIRCASCVWLNEKIIAGIDGIRDVRVNYATGRARVLFDPATTSPVAIFRQIGIAGYSPRPYTVSTAESSYHTERKELLIRFGTAAFLTMQLMASSFALYAGFFQGMGATMKGVMQWFSLAVTTPVVFYSGWPFLKGAWRGIINASPNMDLLITIGALSSYLYSGYALLTGGEVYFETAAMIVTLILVGRLLELTARHRATAGVERLLACAPETSLLVKGADVATVSTAELVPGDLVLVREGERFPVDGVIRSGETEVDESPATGESVPVPKAEGNHVIAGSINLLGSVRVEVLRPAADSFIARIARLVEEAQHRRAPIQNLAERVAAWFVPVVLILAAGTFGFYLATGLAPFSEALMKALAVVVIACPCALGLATPTAIVAGTGAAASRGIIFRGGDILERLSRVKMVVFDKTGTLTEGRPQVCSLQPAPGVTQKQLVSVCAGIEALSSHPLAQGVVAFARKESVPFSPVEGGQTLPGRGVMGGGDRETVIAGTRRFLEEQGISVPVDTDSPAGSTILVALGIRYLGSITLRDTVRSGAADLVSYLHRNGIATEMLSGDRPESARYVAEQVGIRQAKGGMLPEEKAAFVNAREDAGEPILMVGDGINDAPALSAASVGCALAGGTDIALETSSLILTKPDLARIRLAHQLSVRTMRVIRQNLGWAFIYNVIGIPLAMSGRLTPIYAAAAMALSSLCVVGNSLRLIRVK